MRGFGLLWNSCRGTNRYQRKPGGRQYRKRYAGLFRRIALANGIDVAIEHMKPMFIAPYA